MTSESCGFGWHVHGLVTSGGVDCNSTLLFSKDLSHYHHTLLLNGAYRTRPSSELVAPTSPTSQEELKRSGPRTWRSRRDSRATTSSTEAPRRFLLLAAQYPAHEHMLTTHRYCRIGLALADTLDDLISSRRIEPQLAMRIMANFDQSIATVLGEKVKARMTFKV